MTLACFSQRLVPTDLPAVPFCIPWMQDGSGFYRTRTVCVPFWFSILTACLDGLDPRIALRRHLSSPFLCLLVFSLLAYRIVRLTYLLEKLPSARRLVRTVCVPAWFFSPTACPDGFDACIALATTLFSAMFFCAMIPTLRLCVFFFSRFSPSAFYD